VLSPGAIDTELPQMIRAEVRKREGVEFFNALALVEQFCFSAARVAGKGKCGGSGKLRVAYA